MTPQDLKQIDDLLKKRLENVVTKNDLKEALKNYPTKGDLNVTLKEALKAYATKADLKREIEDAIAQIVDAVNESKIERLEFDSLEKRVVKIEKVLEIT